MSLKFQKDARLPVNSITEFASQLLVAVGFPKERALTVARVLVVSDMLGISTHGLTLLPFYIESACNRQLDMTGEPTRLHVSTCSEFWDAGRAAGPWVVDAAMTRGIDLAKIAGISSVLVRRSHHAGSLAPHVLKAADAGFIGLIMCSDPSSPNVAPHGSFSPLLGTNPIAASFPGPDFPLLIDVSTSTLTAGEARLISAAGCRLPVGKVVTATGLPTTDPGVLFESPPGAILPLGGDIAGHKGFALAVLVEMMTIGLSGMGAADERSRCGTSVMLIVANPGLFGGAEAIRGGVGGLIEICGLAQVRSGYSAVRLPGAEAAASYGRAEREGVLVSSAVLNALNRCASQLSVEPYTLNISDYH